MNKYSLKFNNKQIEQNYHYNETQQLCKYYLKIYIVLWLSVLLLLVTRIYNDDENDVIKIFDTIVLQIIVTFGIIVLSNFKKSFNIAHFLAFNSCFFYYCFIQKEGILNYFETEIQTENEIKDQIGKLKMGFILGIFVSLGINGSNFIFKFLNTITSFIVGYIFFGKNLTSPLSIILYIVCFIAFIYQQYQEHKYRRTIFMKYVIQQVCTQNYLEIFRQSNFFSSFVLKFNHKIQKLELEFTNNQLQNIYNIDSNDQEECLKLLRDINIPEKLNKKEGRQSDQISQTTILRNEQNLSINVNNINQKSGNISLINKIHEYFQSLIAEKNKFIEQKKTFINEKDKKQKFRVISGQLKARHDTKCLTVSYYVYDENIFKIDNMKCMIMIQDEQADSHLTKKWDQNMLFLKKKIIEATNVFRDKDQHFKIQRGTYLHQQMYNQQIQKLYKNSPQLINANNNNNYKRSSSSDMAISQYLTNLNIIQSQVQEFDLEKNNFNLTSNININNDESPPENLKINKNNQKQQLNIAETMAQKQFYKFQIYMVQQKLINLYYFNYRLRLREFLQSSEFNIIHKIMKILNNINYSFKEPLKFQIMEKKIGPKKDNIITQNKHLLELYLFNMFSIIFKKFYQFQNPETLVKIIIHSQNDETFEVQIQLHVERQYIEPIKSYYDNVYLGLKGKTKYIKLQNCQDILRKIGPLGYFNIFEKYSQLITDKKIYKNKKYHGKNKPQDIKQQLINLQQSQRKIENQNQTKINKSQNLQKSFGVESTKLEKDTPKIEEIQKKDWEYLNIESSFYQNLTIIYNNSFRISQLNVLSPNINQEKKSSLQKNLNSKQNQQIQQEHNNILSPMPQKKSDRNSQFFNQQNKGKIISRDSLQNSPSPIPKPKNKFFQNINSNNQITSNKKININPSQQFLHKYLQKQNQPSERGRNISLPLQDSSLNSSQSIQRQIFRKGSVQSSFRSKNNSRQSSDDNLKNNNQSITMNNSGNNNKSNYKQDSILQNSLNSSINLQQQQYLKINQNFKSNLDELPEDFENENLKSPKSTTNVNSKLHLNATPSFQPISSQNTPMFNSIQKNQNSMGKIKNKQTLELFQNNNLLKQNYQFMVAEIDKLSQENNSLNSSISQLEKTNNNILNINNNKSNYYNKSLKLSINQQQEKEEDRDIKNSFKLNCSNTSQNKNNIHSFSDLANINQVTLFTKNEHIIDIHNKDFEIDNNQKQKRNSSSIFDKLLNKKKKTLVQNQNQDIIVNNQKLQNYQNQNQQQNQYSQLKYSIQEQSVNTIDNQQKTYSYHNNNTSIQNDSNYAFQNNNTSLNYIMVTNPDNIQNNHEINNKSSWVKKNNKKIKKQKLDPNNSYQTEDISFY